MGFRKRRYYQKGNLKFLNFFINLKSSNPKYMVYGEVEGLHCYFLLKLK